MVHGSPFTEWFNSMPMRMIGSLPRVVVPPDMPLPTTNRQAEVMLCDVELVAVRRESPALLLQICRERGARRVSGRKPAECRHEMVDVGCADLGLGTSRLACAAAC